MAALTLAEYHADLAAQQADMSIPLNVLSIAELYRDNPRDALRLADESRAASERDRNGRQTK